MNKETLLEELNKELENVKLTPYIKMNEDVNDTTVVWSSEYNYDEDYTNERYQEYLDNYTPSEPKSFEAWKEDWMEEMYEEATEGGFDFNPEDYTENELNDMYDDYKESYIDPGPLNKEKWEFDFLESDSQAQWDVKDEDFEFNVFPMIENQCNHNKLILMGTVGRWTGTHAGGEIIDAEEQALRNVMGDYDEVTITDEEGQLHIAFSHHDGTDKMALYTLPENVDEIIQALDVFDVDDLDAQSLEEYKDKLVKIVNKGRGNE